MSVGIIAPYTWDEPTRLAIAAAEHFIDRGLQVSWLATQWQSAGIHNYWDRRVRPLHRASPAGWLEGRTHVIWFEDHPRWLSSLKRSKVRNIRVVLPHRMVEENWECLPYYHKAVLPCDMGREEVDRIGVDYVTSPWDVPVRFVKRGQDWSRPAEASTLLIPLSGRAAAHYGPSLFYALQLLLQQLVGLTVTVVYTRQWKRGPLDALRELQEHCPKRVTVIRKPDYHAQLHAYLAHDWTLWLPSRDSSAIVPLESLAHGSPVISFDVPPVTQFVQDGVHGAILPCQLTGEYFPEVQFRMETLYQGLHSLLRDRDRIFLRHMETLDWAEREERRKAFIAVWAELLD